MNLLILLVLPFLALACSLSTLPLASTSGQQNVASVAQASPAPFLTETAITGHFVTVTAERLYVRPCPSLACYPVRYLKRGDMVDVNGGEGGWLEIKDGWIYGEYVK